MFAPDGPGLYAARASHISNPERAMRANRATMIGAFVLGGIGVAIAAILFFGTFSLFTHPTRAAVFFEGSIGGLSPGAPVAFRGVRIGSVASAALIIDRTDLKARIPVYLSSSP